MSRLKFGHSDSLRGVKAGKIISRYVKKNALFAMLFAVLGLWALQMVFAYLAELEDISDSYTYLEALTYIFYKSPYFFEQFAPTGALLGAVIGLGLLANNSELIIMRAAGLSTYRIVSWVLQPAIIFVIIALAVNQYVLPVSNVKANQINEPDTALLASINGYWTLQQTPATGENGNINEAGGHNILFIDYADANGNIGQVKRWHLDQNNNLTAVSKAAGGVYLPPEKQQSEGNITPLTAAESDRLNYQWELVDVTTLKLAERATIERAEQKIAELEISATQDNAATSNTVASNAEASDTAVSDNSTVSSNTNVQQSRNIVLNDEPLVAKQTQEEDLISLPIAPSSVYLLTRRAEDLSLTQLYDHKRFNDSQGTRSLEHEVAFWQKLLSPFAILSLVIVACSFVFGSLRTHSLGLRIVVALIFGLLFDYIQDLTSFVALATGASPLLMVLLPIIGSAMLGLYLLKRQG